MEPVASYKKTPRTLQKTSKLLNLLVFFAIASASPLAAHAAAQSSGTNAQIGPAGTNVLAGGNSQADAIENQIHRFIDEQTSRVPGRIEVEVGQIDPRLTLAPCARAEPFLPLGAKLWGKSSIGLRCVSGATWSANIPLYVRVFGLTLVANRSIQAGQALQRDDFSEQEAELSKEGGRPVSDFGAIDNKTLNRSVAAGAILREEWLRASPVIQSGDQVRVVASGAGFSITTDGYAITSAVEGQQVKVRSDGGRVVTGIARPGRIAEIRM